MLHASVPHHYPNKHPAPIPACTIPYWIWRSQCGRCMLCARAAESNVINQLHRPRAVAFQEACSWRLVLCRPCSCGIVAMQAACMRHAAMRTSHACMQIMCNPVHHAHMLGHACAYAYGPVPLPGPVHAQLCMLTWICACGSVQVSDPMRADPHAAPRMIGMQISLHRPACLVSSLDLHGLCIVDLQHAAK